jgi:hypothetical protein
MNPPFGTERCALVLSSIHWVIRAETLLKQQSFWVDIIPIPREISSECGMALEFACADWPAISQLFTRHQIETIGLYQLNHNLFEPYRPALAAESAKD